MREPIIADPTAIHAQHRRLFYRRLFRWGIWFWILAWCFSILVHLQFVVNLKGWWGMRFFMGTGSMGVMFDSFSTGSGNYIRWGEPMFLWSQPYLDQIRKNPEGCVGILGRVGWSGHGYYHTMAFPIAGFLWLWLIGTWYGDFKRPRRVEFRRNGPMIGRVAILILLPLILLIGDYKGRRANETTGCVLNVRNIQQALRGYQGVNELGVGKVIPWSDLIGPGKMLGAHCRECPGGQAYRLIPRMPDAGVLAAECPNPEHQRRIKEADTSGW